MRANWLECASMRLRTKQMNTKPAETKERLSWQVLPRSLRPFGPLEFNLKTSKWWLYFACVTFVQNTFVLTPNDDSTGVSEASRRLGWDQHINSFPGWTNHTWERKAVTDSSGLNPRYLFRKLHCQLVSAIISPAINSSLLQTKRLNDTNLMFPFIKFFFHVCSTWTKNITSSHRKRPCQHNEFAT